MQIQLDLSKHRVLLMQSLTCKTFFYDFFYLFHFISLTGVTYSVFQSLILKQYLLAIFPIFVIVYWLFTTINYFSLYNDNYKETILAAGAFVTTYLGVLNTNPNLNTFDIFMIEFLTIITYFIISMTYYHHIHVITKILEANYLAFLLTKFDLPEIERLPKILRTKGKEAIESYQFEFNNLAQVENLSYKTITPASPKKKHHNVADFAKQPFSEDIESPGSRDALELVNARDLSPSYPLVASSIMAPAPPPSAQKSGYVMHSMPGELPRPSVVPSPPCIPSAQKSGYVVHSPPRMPPKANEKMEDPLEKESKAQEQKNKQTPAQFWTCSKCTYDNSEERQNCALCDSPKPIV